MSPDPSLSFEQALAELERILRTLEDGTTTLEQSLTQYERGVALVKRCHEQLRSAEQRIQLLSGVDEAGNPQLSSFEHSSAVESPKSTEKRRSKKSDGELFG